MKKIFLAALSLAVLSMSSLTSCVTSGSALSQGTSTAQTSSSSTQSTAANVLGSLLGGLIGNAVPVTEASIVGTWVYQSPEVRFESEDFLSKAGGEVAAATIENKLAEMYSKVGIVPGSSSFTFNEDKTCLITLGSKSIGGTYTIDSSTHEISIKSNTGLIKLNGKVYFSLNSLAIIFNADKVLSVVQGVSAVTGQGSGTLSTISSMLGQYKGLMLGMNLNK